MNIRTAPPEHFPWIAERAGLVVGPAFTAVEAMDDKGRIHGMIGFDGFLPNSLSMSIALDNPAVFTKLLVPAMWWVFEGAKKNLATCAVLSTNKRSLRLVQHVGFREVFRGRNWWQQDVDLVFFEMRRTECRWLPKAEKEAA